VKPNTTRKVPAATSTAPPMSSRARTRSMVSRRMRYSVPSTTIGAMMTLIRNDHRHEWYVVR
jgi:hypothetical protein